LSYHQGICLRQGCESLAQEDDAIGKGNLIRARTDATGSDLICVKVDDDWAYTSRNQFGEEASSILGETELLERQTFFADHIDVSLPDALLSLDFHLRYRLLSLPASGRRWKRPQNSDHLPTLRNAARSLVK
jgi:hypothetical protein